MTDLNILRDKQCLIDKKWLHDKSSLNFKLDSFVSILKLNGFLITQGKVKASYEDTSSGIRKVNRSSYQE